MHTLARIHTLIHTFAHAHILTHTLILILTHAQLAMRTAAKQRARNQLNAVLEYERALEEVCMCMSVSVSMSVSECVLLNALREYQRALEEVCMCMCMCMCMRVCGDESGYVQCTCVYICKHKTHARIYIYINTCIYMCEQVKGAPDVFFSLDTLRSTEEKLVITRSNPSSTHAALPNPTQDTPAVHMEDVEGDDGAVDSHTANQSHTHTNTQPASTQEVETSTNAPTAPAHTAHTLTLAQAAALAHARVIAAGPRPEVRVVW
jgi:hypothetical protein